MKKTFLHALIISQSFLLSPMNFTPVVEARRIFPDWTSWSKDSLHSPGFSFELAANNDLLLFTNPDPNFEADDLNNYEIEMLNRGQGSNSGSSTTRPQRHTLPAHLGGFSYFPPVSNVGASGAGAKGNLNANEPNNRALEKLRLFWRRIFRRRTSNDEEALCHFKLCMPSRSFGRL